MVSGRRLAHKFMRTQAGTEDTFPGPPTFKESHEAFFFRDFYHYELHLHAISLSFAMSGLNE